MAVGAGQQVAQPVAVDLIAQAALGLDLVAFGDRDVAHVVAQAGDLERALVGDGRGGPAPSVEVVADFVVFRWPTTTLRGLRLVGEANLLAQFGEPHHFSP